MNILSLLGVAQNEKKNTYLLIGNNFFEGLAIALFYSVALTYFLDHNPISAYGWLMVISAAFVMLFTVIYQKIEHALETGKLFMFLAIMTVVVFLTGFSLTSFGFGLSEAYIGFGLMILHHFIYFLYKIRFWGLSALFFDVRQSKRIFGLIGSVNLPAKFIGFTLVTTLGVLSDLGYENLLLFGVLSYMISAAFMFLVIRRNPETMHVDHHTDKYKSVHSKSIIKGIWLLSLAMMFTLSFISFLFAKEVQHHFEVTDGNMFQLISIALAISYGLATIVKIVISGKVLGRYKLRTLLLITPIMLAVAVLIHWIIRSSFQLEDLEYLFFVMLMIGSLVLTEAIDTPLVMSLFQPLSKQDILSGHTKVKGFGESIGVMLVGILLIIFYHGHNHIELVYAIPIVFATSVAWLIAARHFSIRYLFDLRHLIELKLITGQRVLFMDREMERHLIDQMESRDIKVVAHAIETLAGNDRLRGRQIRRLLDSRRIAVRQLALDALQDKKLLTSELRDQLHAFVDEAENEEKHALLTVLCSAGTPDEIENYLLLEDNDERIAVAKGLAKNSEYDHTSWLQSHVEKWMNPATSQHIREALDLMTSFIHPSNVQHLKENLKVGAEYNSEAIDASEPYLLELRDSLLVHFNDRRVYRKLVRIFKDASMEVINAYEPILSRTTDVWVDVLLANNNLAVTKLLLPILQQENPETRHNILRGLVSKGSIQITKNELAPYLERENLLLERLNFIFENDDLTNSALELERNDVIERILGYCYLFTHEKVLLNAQKELFLNGENKMALCVEALQVSLPPDLFKSVRKVLETRELPEKDLDGSKTLALFEVKGQLGKWLNLMLLDKWKDLAAFENDKMIDEMNDNKVQRIDRVLMLKQTQMFEEIRDNRLLDIADLMDEVIIEKDSYVFQKGDQGDSLYIIVDGQIAIMDGEHALAKFGRGDFFGDLSLLDPAPRSAGAKALSKSKLLYLDQSAIYELMYDHIEVVKGILGALCKRIRNQNKVYIEEKNKVSV